MSKSLVTTSDIPGIKEIKKQFIELTAEGNIETRTLELLNLSRGKFVRMCIEDPDFAKDIEEARKARAEFWVSKIAQSVEKDYEKDEIPNQKLKFDKLMFLAKADNPERYGGNKTKLDINLDLKQFKLLPPEEAVKALTEDPFAAAIEVEFTDISKDTSEELL